MGTRIQSQTSKQRRIFKYFFNIRRTYRNDVLIRNNFHGQDAAARNDVFPVFVFFNKFHMPCMNSHSA